jgi:L-arabinose transport system substrate-binding protein
MESSVITQRLDRHPANRNRNAMSRPLSSFISRCAQLSFSALLLLVAGCSSQPDAGIKIGFLVKQAEEPWFQDEWRYAEQAAQEKNFTLVKIAAPDGEKVMSAIDNLAAQGAKGFIICAPDVKLGSAIVAKSKSYGLKLMSVDDRLLDGQGREIESVPHMGLSAYEIGKQVGQALVAEMQWRGWNPGDVGAIRIAYDQLPTARERTQGTADALLAAGFPQANIIAAPQAKTDTENAFNAANIAMTAHPNFTHWLAFGLNDEAALGAVRAAEGRGIHADNMVAVGIGGSQAAINEFAKPQATAFFGTVLISSKRHGYETSINLYNWITKNEAPPALVLTQGILMTRANQEAVRKQMGLQ